MRKPPAQTQQLTKIVKLKDGRFRISFKRPTGKHVSLVISEKDADRLQIQLSELLGHWV